MGKPKKEARYVSRVAVAVTGAGCIDMMRYDSCFPATEEDAHKIMRIAAYEGAAEDRFVVFTRVARNSDDPNEERWRSFGCRVLAVRHPDDPLWTADELRKLAETARGAR